MREILFRGKRTDTKEWIEGVAFPHDNDKVTMFRQHFVDGVLVGEEVDPETVGQYTGLTDKNGTKIFEGDILRNSLDSSTAIVKWGFPHTGFVLEMKGTVYAFTKVGSELYEVLGNIYDNPELIGGKNNG